MHVKQYPDTSAGEASTAGNRHPLNAGDESAMRHNRNRA
jgi:hypothetical protein